MSSFARNLQRKRLRQSADHEPRAQITKPLTDGGYVTIRYTRGARRVSARRLMAQAMVARILHAGQEREQSKVMVRGMLAAQRAVQNTKRIEDLVTAPVIAVTRQMRRHALRKGSAVPTLISATA